MDTKFEWMQNLDKIKYIVVLERDQEVAVIFKGKIRLKMLLPEFECSNGEFSYDKIIKDYKLKTGYEIINLIFKGVIKKTIIPFEKYEYTLIFKGTECYGSPKVFGNEALRWIRRDRLHRYPAGERVEKIVNLLDGSCREFIYNASEDEFFEKDICMIENVFHGNLEEAESVIKASFSTVADTYAFTKEDFPNFAGYYVDRLFLLRLLSDDDQYLFGYFDDNRLLGVGAIKHNKKERDAVLSLLCTLPDFRHMNIGDDLLNYAIEKARSLSCYTIRLEIMYENTILKDWMELHGFFVEKTEKLANYPFTLATMKKPI